MEQSIRIPSHVAIVMDGNGRWAKARGKNRVYGHKKGSETVRKIIKHSSRIGVSYLTLFAFSTENWSRPKREVGALMKLFEQLLDREVPELYKNNVRIRFTGRRTHLSGSLIERMENAETVTQKNTGLNLILAMDYGGKQEILDSFKKLARQLSLKQIEKLETEDIKHFLYLPDVPDPDLIIRTSGERRISNFLLWEAVYSEMYYTDVFWPDFDEKELDRAIKDFSGRERRFGKVT